MKHNAKVTYWVRFGTIFLLQRLPNPGKQLDNLKISGILWSKMLMNAQARIKFGIFCFKKSKSEKNILNRSKKPMKWRRHVSFSQKVRKCLMDANHL